MYQKYALTVPLYVRRRGLRMGIALTRSMMSNWVIQCASAWLKPMCERMREKLLTYD
ncbi:IS66 family transposase [Desulfosporosinus youngiae]|uniref:IS66 family transposase n=1 Tax=Desulfosporosinus youngiae TaxID=339862 RepID=UPI0009FCD4E9